MRPKVLYFIADNRPTNYERQRAAKLDAAVAFRSVRYVKSTDAAEQCDGVTGNPIPTQYVGKPSAEDAIYAFAVAKAIAPQIPLQFNHTATPTTTDAN